MFWAVPSSWAAPSLPSSSSLSVPPLTGTGLPETGPEKDPRERRAAIQGSHQTPPTSVSRRTPNQCSSLSILVLNGCFIAIRVEMK